MKEYATSNDNYKIQQPATRADFFSLEEDLIPDSKVDNKRTYAPLRNVHIYGVNSHKKN